jgi:hypothetical protein
VPLDWDHQPSKTEEEDSWEILHRTRKEVATKGTKSTKKKGSWSIPSVNFVFFVAIFLFEVVHLR